MILYYGQKDSIYYFYPKKNKYINCVQKFYIHTKFSLLNYRCIKSTMMIEKKKGSQFHYNLSQWRNSLVVAQ